MFSTVLYGTLSIPIPGGLCRQAAHSITSKAGRFVRKVTGRNPMEEPCGSSRSVGSKYKLRMGNGLGLGPQSCSSPINQATTYVNEIHAGYGDVNGILTEKTTSSFGMTFESST